jgi:hypothetical protein
MTDIDFIKKKKKKKKTSSEIVSPPPILEEAWIGFLLSSAIDETSEACTICLSLSPCILYVIYMHFSSMARHVA